jgi:mRNA interferase MazF
MEEPLRGQVVTVLYPYSDLSGVKRRPALVLGRLSVDDYLRCQITSQPLVMTQILNLIQNGAPL